MSNPKVDVCIAVTAQVAGGERIEIGHKNVQLEADENGKAALPAGLFCVCECAGHADK